MSNSRNRRALKTIRWSQLSFKALPQVAPLNKDTLLMVCPTVPSQQRLLGGSTPKLRVRKTSSQRSEWTANYTLYLARDQLARCSPLGTLALTFASSP